MTLPPTAWLSDLRGNRLGTACAVAAQALEDATSQWLQGQSGVPASLAQATQADPAWALPRVLAAAWWLAQGEAHSAGQAHALMAELPGLLATAPAREQAHAEAAAALLDGRWHHACRSWDDLLLAHPRDPLALLQAHHWALRLGRQNELRARPARVLPEWDEADPLYPQVLGLYALGLADNQLYPQAEDIARRALADGQPVPLAVQAVAQVMHWQGRFEDGTAWLRQHQAIWADAAPQASLGWWLMGLFRLEAMDEPGLQRLVDAHLSGPGLRTASQRHDAISLLWRMHLVGIDVSARFALLLQDGALDGDQQPAGEHAFADLQVMLALLGAADTTRAEHWLARCAAHIMQAEEARRSNHAVARQLGLPLMRALLTLGRGDAQGAVQGLHALHATSHRLGGSQAQREWLDLSLLAAAAAAPDPAIGRAWLNERLLTRELTPLTRHWAARLGNAL
jgi:hypothetical protein